MANNYQPMSAAASGSGAFLDCFRITARLLVFKTFKKNFKSFKSFAVGIPQSRQ
jgi:hypothetical protein